MSKSIYICSKCNKDISDKTRYRIYVKSFLYYEQRAILLKTIDLCSGCYNTSTIEIVKKQKKEKKKIEEPEKTEKRTFIFNPIKGTLKDTSWDRTLKLTKLEIRFIGILSNGRMNTWEDMNQFIYQENYHNKFSACDIRRRLLEKIDMNIRLVRKGGFILEDEILIES